jgi:hypothetical protein
MHESAQLIIFYNRDHNKLIKYGCISAPLKIEVENVGLAQIINMMENGKMIKVRNF